MARNSEKAQSMLFRFRAQQAADLGIIDLGRTTRPKLITSVTTVSTCERWRGQVLKEISRKISRIQDPALSDYQLRDLNDEINKLMREKHVWEIQIRQLGGPNYARGGSVHTEDGRLIEGAGRGYRYFGRARELPGVKEMFEASTKPRDDLKKHVRQDTWKHVNADYYGFIAGSDEEKLLSHETNREREAQDSVASQGDGLQLPVNWQSLPGDVGDGMAWRVPTIPEAQGIMIERRKAQLLDKL